jgi:hypothetical protein
MLVLGGRNGASIGKCRTRDALQRRFEQHSPRDWLGRQDSDFCSAPQLGLPLSCGAKSGRRSCLGRCIFRARRSVRHQSFEDAEATRSRTCMP